MKVRIVNTDLPGGFIIEAETPEDVLILRLFCNDNRDIYIANHGGNIGEGRMSMLIAHKGDANPRPEPIKDPLIIGERPREGDSNG